MLLFACSGPGAASEMLRSTEYSYDHAAFVVGLLVLSLALSLIASQYRLMPLVEAALLLLHPAWTMSAYGGDCGYSKVNWSFAFTIMAASIVGLQLGLLARSDSRKFVNVVIVASWLTPIAAFVVAAYVLFALRSTTRSYQEESAITDSCVVTMVASAAILVILAGARLLITIRTSPPFRVPSSDGQ
jgi:hypothetical protein